MTGFKTRSFTDIRQALLDRRELALLDVREEAPYAEAHPLFAANASLSRLELDILARVPRRNTAITVYDNGEGLAARAATRLADFGYTDVALLAGGLSGWREAGGELFRDVNVPSKSFGELVESKRHTPSFSAQEVKALIDDKADIVILDARRFDEYNTMSIPSGTSVPGAELVLRVRELAPDPKTRVIVNCAGRTRSIIGTQSLVNAAIPNPVAALRNGTIGWTLAGQALEHGQQRRFKPVSDETRRIAAAAARKVADRARVNRANRSDLQSWRGEPDRTTYLFDVRTPEEFTAGHVPDSRPIAGGQLVQETDHYAAVRGARIVLIDDDGARANMTGSWLAQMGWETYVLDDLTNEDFSERGDWQPTKPSQPAARTVSPQVLKDWLDRNAARLFDVAPSANYAKGHIPGATFILRAQIADLAAQGQDAEHFVLTCGSSLLAGYAAADLQTVTDKEVYVLAGGTAAWQAAGFPLESGEQHLASPRIDRYRRPYEGTDNATAAMQAYLDWEFGLVDQLARDGTHGFYVI